jgi:multicomponent K+:H+ antiporter subunit G
MTGAAELPNWAALLAALLVLLGAGLTFTGSLGLLRLGTFYKRVHAPTLGTTLGTAFILAGSMVTFSVLQTRPVIHELLILVFITVTTPVTLMLLVRAAVFRDRAEGNLPLPGRDAASGGREAELGGAKIVSD